MFPNQPTYSGAVSNQNSPAKFSLGSLKCTLGEILASVRVEPASSPILGTSYMMSSGSDHNPAWNQLTKPRAAQLLSLLDKSALERLETNPFKQVKCVSMHNVLVCLFFLFLRDITCFYLLCNTAHHG